MKLTELKEKNVLFRCSDATDDKSKTCKSQCVYCDGKYGETIN